MEGARWSTNALGPDYVIRRILSSGITVSSVTVMELFNYLVDDLVDIFSELTNAKRPGQSSQS
jgi:DNA phosphorothioation-dependent restriction protein DptG